MSNPRIIFFFDIDNTLLDNDRVTLDIHHKLEEFCGVAACNRYWEIFEQKRTKHGYADYLAALQAYRLEEMHDPRILSLSLYLTDYPFANRLFPGSLDAIDFANQNGRAVILSDGDAVFQPRKTYRAGIFDAVDNRVLIYIHKEQELDRVERLYPADHYIMIDDKLRILTAMKKIWGERLTTVFVRQGHYAIAPGVENEYPAADVSINHIGELPTVSLDDLLLRNSKQ